MANPIVRVANVLGKAVGTFQKSKLRAQYGKQPSFLGAWAEEGKWRLSDASQRQAQRRAVQNSWIFTAISLIAREVGAAKFQVVRYQGVENESIQISNHPLEEVLRRPNSWMGESFLWQYTTWWLQLNGNGYWYIGLSSSGEVAEIWPLPSEDVDPRPGDEKRFIDTYEYTVGGRQYNIPAELIVHFRLPNPFDIFRGMSPLKAAMLPVDTDTFMSRWNASFFGRDNVMPSAIINLVPSSPEQQIDSTDVEMLKSDLKAGYQAFKRKTAVTSVTKLEVEQLGWAPKDLDFISGRQFTKEEIYEIYGIPGGLLDKNATRANSENAEVVFKGKTIWPLLVLMSEQLTAELTMPYYGKEYAAEFEDIRVVSRELQLQEISGAGPYLTIDEVRKRFYKAKELPDGRGSLTAVEVQVQSQEMGMPFDGETVEGSLVPPKRLSAPKFQERLVVEDLKRWQRKSLNALRTGKSIPVDFRSDVIPFWLLSLVEQKLSLARGMKSEGLDREVKRVFREVTQVYFPFL